MLMAYSIITACLFLIVIFGAISTVESANPPSTRDFLEMLGVVFGWPLLFPLWGGMGIIFLLINSYKFLAKNL